MTIGQAARASKVSAKALLYYVLARLLAAADDAGERVWQLPLIDEYRDGRIARFRNFVDSRDADRSGGS